MSVTPPQLPSVQIGYWASVACHVLTAAGAALTADGVLTATQWREYAGPIVAALGALGSLAGVHLARKAIDTLKVHLDDTQRRLLLASKKEK